MTKTVFTLCLALAAAGGWSLLAQTPASPDQRVHANMNQLMRGVLYPAANVVFSAQADNPADVKPGPLHDPNMSTDPLTSTFGGWLAVENAALALAESATLVSLEGRPCSNGVVAPTKDPAWVAFVQQMRDGGLQAFKAAQAKDQEKIIEASETLNGSCAGCHRRFRDRKARAPRCQ